jgi:hypothetical protein
MLPTGMTVVEMLDLSENFHVIEANDEGWSVVDWGCSCPKCYKYVICVHRALLEMIFNSKLVVAPFRRKITVPNYKHLKEFASTLQKHLEDSKGCLDKRGPLSVHAFDLSSSAERVSTPLLWSTRVNSANALVS